MGARCAIHTNTGLAHQVRIARALVDGFAAHGINAEITGRDSEADLHVCMGPWFALDLWRFDALTLYIDRAYWGDPDSVSVHWLQSGEKVFTRCDIPRAHPELKPYRFSEKSIFLCDYNQQPVGVYDAVRYHPANGQRGSLAESLEGFGVAAGGRTTALVDAAILGLKVVTFDEHSPLWPISGRREGREKWINNLAWHNWSLDELAEGEFLDAISDDNPGDLVAGIAGRSQVAVPHRGG